MAAWATLGHIQIAYFTRHVWRIEEYNGAADLFGDFFGGVFLCSSVRGTLSSLFDVC